MEQQID
jgi:hypothetical protein